MYSAIDRNHNIVRGHTNPLSIKTQGLHYGNMWKLLAKILGMVHTNGNVVNATTSEMAHTLG